MTGMFFRSFFIQAWWNFEGMQNLGFLFGLSPVLRRLYPDRDAYREALSRHFGYFNTNPYMIGWVAGVVAGLEEDRAALPDAERAAADKKIESVKRLMGSSVAAMGDTFFWGALRPACAALTVFLWVVLWTLGAAHPVLIGCLAYLALYNAPALWARWRGLKSGLALREKAADELKNLRWRKKTRWVRAAGLAAAAAVAAGALLVPPWGSAAGLGNAFLLAAAIGLRGARIPTHKSYGAAIVIGAGMSFL